MSSLLLVITSNAGQQRSQHHRPTNDSPSKRVQTLPKTKPPREVSLRVKFIRLGEVNI
jgi:hypothetical protein